MRTNRVHETPTEIMKKEYRDLEQAKPTVQDGSLLRIDEKSDALPRGLVPLQHRMSVRNRSNSNAFKILNEL